MKTRLHRSSPSEQTVTLLDNIRSDLVNESASLANTLRKAKILASDIGLPEFGEWVDSELNGYRDRESVPQYRRVRPTSFGTVAGNMRVVRNVVLPTSHLPDVARDFAENFSFGGAAELEAQASRAPLNGKWTQELLVIAREVTLWSGGVWLAPIARPRNGKNKVHFGE